MAKGTTFKGAPKPYGASGHFDEPRRHSLQAKGFKTGHLADVIPHSSALSPLNRKMRLGEKVNVNLLANALKRIPNIKEVGIDYLNKEKNSVNIVVKTSAGVDIILWGMPNSQFFYEDLKVPKEIPQHEIDVLNKINRELEQRGIKNIPHIKSLKPTSFVTAEQMDGDMIEYDYAGSLSYMPSKKGRKSGFSGTMEVYKDPEMEKPVQLDITKSVTQRLKGDGFDFGGAKTDEEYDKVQRGLQDRILEDKTYLKELQSLSRRDLR